MSIFLSDMRVHPEGVDHHHPGLGHCAQQRRGVVVSHTNRAEEHSEPVGVGPQQSKTDYFLILVLWKTASSMPEHSYSHSLKFEIIKFSQ